MLSALSSASPLLPPNTERPSSRDDFARYLADADAAEKKPFEKQVDPLSEHPSKHPAEQESSPEKRPEKRLENQDAGAVVLRPASLQPMLQELSLAPLPTPPELPPELPPDLHLTVHLGAMPAGPRIRLDAPPEPAPAPPAVVPVAAEAVTPVEEVLAEPGFISEAPLPEEPTKEPTPSIAPEMPHLPMEARSEAPAVTPLEKAEVPELAAPLPHGLNLEIKDPVGRWELGVVRTENTVHLEVHGDQELKRIIQESTKELGQKLARHGDTLGSVQWRPIAATVSAQEGRNDQAGERRDGQQQQPSSEEKPQKQPRKAAPEPQARRALRVI